jgi:nucleotide-binding universal stress UspA family protein
MIRSILLALAEAPNDVSARNYAFWLAKKEGSQIHALAVIDIAAFEVPVLGTSDGFMPSVVTPPIAESQSLLEDLTTVAKERLDEFAGQCAARNIPCSIDIKTGIPGEVIARSAVAHDIVVVSRSGYNRFAGMRETVDALVAPVIRGSVRPVLVAGPEFPEGSDIRRILIAYDGSPHASRALKVASELASRPGVECTLVTVSQSEEAGEDILAPAEEYLLNHRITPQKRIMSGSKPSDVICDLVSKGEVDLLIMGAYGHSPIREVLFGSTTERILTNCAANVILQS